MDTKQIKKRKDGDDDISAIFVEKPKKAKREGIVLFVTSTEVVLNVSGNGERIPYVEKEHKNLKPGDKIYIE